MGRRCLHVVGVLLGFALSGLFGAPVAATQEPSPTPPPPPPAAGPDCVATAYQRAIPGGEREGVVLVESRVELYDSEEEAQESMENQLEAFLQPGGVDHSEDDQAKELRAIAGSFAIFDADPVLLTGLGAFRDGRVLHTIFAVKVARTGLPMFVSDDVFEIIEKVQEHRAGRLEERVLTGEDLGADWLAREAELLPCT